VRCNEAVFSKLIHNEINLDEAKGGRPQKKLYGTE